MAGMERFTQRARRVLTLAHQEAERLNQAQIGTEHLLLGLMMEDGGISARVLADLGLEIDRVREMVERLGGFGQVRGAKIELSAGVQQVLEFAIDEARRMGHHYIGTEHLLLGLIRQEEGLGMDVLRKLGITPEQIRRQTRRVLQENNTSTAGAQGGDQTPKAEKSADKGKESKSKTPLVDHPG
jgi:ATP-dependent Clp protease ATP-binding subunit ClpC